MRSLACRFAPLRRLILLVAACALTAGCYTFYDYVGPPDGALKYGSGFEPVDPNPFRVDPRQFPQFRVAAERRAPRYGLFSHGVFHDNSSEPVIPVILPGDIWHVRYRYKDYLMVNSQEFDHRECLYRSVAFKRDLHYKADGTCEWGWCIYIDLNGVVTGGWEQCPVADRYVFAPDPDVVRMQDWGPQPFFQAIPRR